MFLLPSLNYSWTSCQTGEAKNSRHHFYRRHENVNLRAGDQPGSLVSLGQFPSSHLSLVSFVT